MKWYSCQDKSFTPPVKVYLLLAHTAQHFPTVDLAIWDGETWFNPHDLDYIYRDTEVKFWTHWPKYPEKVE